MNPDKNVFEKLESLGVPEEHIKKDLELLTGVPHSRLVRPNGEPVPETWSIYTEGEQVVVKNYTFKVAHIGESYMVLEPVGPVLVGEEK